MRFLKRGCNCVFDVTESDKGGGRMKMCQVLVVIVVYGVLFLF
jgi:hypothetical protein